MPGGVVWTESGEILGLLGDDPVASLAKTVDPHSLVTDGRRLFWLGHERNGWRDLVTAEVGRLPAAGDPAGQEALAYGDGLYARSRPDGLWRLDLQDARRMPFHPDPSWRLLPGLTAGDHTVALPAAIPGAGAPQFRFVRIDRRNRVATAATTILPRLGSWAIGGAGDLAFIADAHGTVAVWKASEPNPKPAFVQAGSRMLCWCDGAVCTFGEAVRRHPTGAAAQLIATELGSFSRISCDDDRVAWKSEQGDGSVIITQRRTAE